MNSILLQIPVLFFLFISTLTYGQTEDNEKEVIIQKIIIDKSSGDTSVVVIDEASSGHSHSFVFKSDSGAFVMPPHPPLPHMETFAWTDSLSSGKGYKYLYKFGGDTVDFDFDFDIKAFADSGMNFHRLDSNFSIWLPQTPMPKMSWDFHDSVLFKNHEILIEKFDDDHMERIFKVHPNKIPHFDAHSFHIQANTGSPRIIIIQKDGTETIKIEENDSITVVGTGDDEVEVFVYKSKSKGVNVQVKSLENKELKNLAKEQNISGEPTLGISELKVKPNPNNGRFSLSYHLPSEDVSYIRIIDSAGKAVFAKKTSGKYVNEYIDVSNDTKGVFFIIVEQLNKYYTRKVFIE